MKKTIYYHDTDAGGVVYYGRYLNYLEESRTEFLSNVGLSVSKMHQKGFLYAVKKCTLNYKSPARYADIIECQAKIIKVSAAQIFFVQKIFNAEDNRLLLEAEIVLVSLTKEFKPTPIPDDIKSLLESNLK